MLRDVIRSTALTTKQANACFADKINGDEFRGDQSMTAIARALFYHRLADQETITIRLISDSVRDGNFDVDSLRISAADLQSGQLKIVNMSAHGDQSGSWVEQAREALSQNGLYQLDALEQWYAKASTVCAIYTDRPYDPDIPRSPIDNTKTLIVVENLTITKWHLIGALLPRFFGKWFQETPRTPEETALLSCMQQDNDSEFQRLVSEVASQYDFRGASIRALLGDFEGKFAKSQIGSLEEACRNIDEQINSLNRQIGTLLQDRDMRLATLEGFRSQKPDEIEPATMNFFLKNKNLFLNDATDDYLDFYVTAWLSNWDPEKAKNCFVKERCSGWLEDNEKFKVSNEDALRLYKAIFIEESVKVKLWSHIRLNLRNGQSWQLYGDGAIPEIQNALPNPHHHYNLCGGANSAYVNQCLIDHNIIGALAQCMSATAGINLVEHASYAYFCKDLFDPSNGKVVYIKETEKFVTAKEAIKWLKKDKKDEKKEKEAKTAHE